MIIVYNIITLCKYLIGFTRMYSIEFEYIEDDNEYEEICYCNLCYTVRNIILFATRRLKCNKV